MSKIKMKVRQMIKEQKNFEEILTYLERKPKENDWQEWAKYERIRCAVINMFPRDVKTAYAVNGLLSITVEKARKEAREYLINKFQEVNMEQIRQLTREERLEINTRNGSDRMVDIWLESDRPVHKELALDIAGEYYARAKNIKHDGKISVMGALLERAKNLGDCMERDQLLNVIFKNLGFDAKYNPMEGFKIRALQTVVKGKDDKTKERCVKHLLSAFKGR